MRSIFTAHAGEYLVGSDIEKRFKKYNVWVPSKDTGVDLLITNAKNRKMLGLQVKFSKDYATTYMKPEYRHKFTAWGWWTLNRDKIKKSTADLWVFVMQSFEQKTIECVVISPNMLLQKLGKIHRKSKTIQLYLWVTNKNKCWDTRGLKKAEKILVANDSYPNKLRDFTPYLNNWTELKKKLR